MTIDDIPTPVLGLVKVKDERLSWVPPIQAITAANRALEEHGSGWRLEILTGTTPFVVPVEVSYHRPAGEQPLTDLADLTVFLGRDLPDPVRLVADVMLVPSPGHKGSGSHHAFTRGDLDRVPVAVVTPEPPPRRSSEQLGGRRRPVVVLLDTKVDQHPWLGRPDGTLGRDGFWVDAGSLGWDPGDRLIRQKPVPDGVLGDGTGHGTFSAGLVRQVAPDAQVLAVQAMPDDGDVYGDHILNALAWVADHVETGDVVCVPACFRPQLPSDRVFGHWLADAMALLGPDVTVVAAAGNDGSDEPVYPAAFATEAVDAAPTVSVGALNTDGTTPAYYSNFGGWVTAQEIGSSLISTFPRINGARAPELTSGERRSTDPDDFAGGFARWSGTSFAAAVHAGRLARRQLDGTP